MSGPSPKTRIVIIGGGFSGVMTAVNLACLSPHSLQLTVINEGRPMGRGVAYGTRRMEHLLNVAARNMSAFPDRPDHFLQWLRTRSEYDTVPQNELRERFIPRMIYGDYLRSLMQHYLQVDAASTLVDTTFVEGQVEDVVPSGTEVRVLLKDGSCHLADRVVLATGNEAPADLPGSVLLREHDAWVGNPWVPWEQRLPAPGGTIVLLGTGLTTVDAVLALRAIGWQGRVDAVSRHGWLPQSHFRGIEYAAFPPADVDLAKLGLEKLVTLVEEHCLKLREMGANPAIIVDKLRPHTQRIWAHFSLVERRQFAGSYAARWNILRHRIAPEIHAQVTTAQLTGYLRVHAASILRVDADESRVRVALSNGESLVGDLVINATGPHTAFEQTSSRLLQKLHERGLLAPDEMGMGVRVNEDHQVIEPDGRVSPWFLALGPLLKGSFWETIAVPELRGQARRVAETLLHLRTTQEPEQVMMEFMI